MPRSKSTLSWLPGPMLFLATTMIVMLINVLLRRRRRRKRGRRRRRRRIIMMTASKFVAELALVERLPLELGASKDFSCC